MDNAHLSGGEYRNLRSETMTDVNSNLAVVTEEEILQMLTFSWTCCVVTEFVYGNTIINSMSVKSGF